MPVQAGLIRKYNGDKVVVVKTGLSADGEDAVVVARLTQTKPSGTTPSVRAKTYVTEYWVLIGQAKTVKVTQLGTTWTPPNRLGPADVRNVQREFDKITD
ncbi:hypothetical protein [Lentzea sp.]|uniref:hypothetical protein n=1 Tax=Lentzea sp. TaxID=56099 RepID=UPI002ED509FC